MKVTTLHQARLGFKFSNQVENKSPRTIQWYDDKIAEFEAFLLGRAMDQGEAGSPPISDVAVDTIRSYIEHLQARKTTLDNHPTAKPRDRPLSPYTIRGCFRSLATFFAWSEKEGLITASPFAKLKAPKVPKIIKPRFSEEDIKKLLEACGQYDETIGVRNRVIILFLLSTGVRAGELVGLALDRVDLERGRAHVTGKGAKDREVFFGRNARLALWQYVTIYRPPHARSSKLFVTREGEDMTVSRLQHVLRDIGDRAGVKNCHPHRFRHTAARMMLRNGADAFAVQRALGHESLDMTRKYIELESEDMELACARADPVDRWNLK
jgi:site-specific recombinase XerD